MATKISFQSSYKGFVLKQKKELSQWILSAIKSEKKTAGEITFAFCSDQELLEVNKQFLEHDYFTDIITFQYGDSQVVSGDIMISVDRVRDNSLKFSQIEKNELHRVMIHGVLHLAGYTDKKKSDKKLMTEKEDYYLAKRKFK